MILYKKLVGKKGVFKCKWHNKKLQMHKWEYN